MVDVSSQKARKVRKINDINKPVVLCGAFYRHGHV